VHATFLEVVQALFAGLGAALTTRAMVSADLDLLALLRAGLNGNRKSVAEKNVRVERCVLLVQLALFLAGMASLWLPPPPFGYPGAPTEFNALLARGATITRIAMSFASVTLMYMSYRNWLEHRIPLTTVRRTDAVPTGPAVAQAAASEAQLAAVAMQATAVEAQNAATHAQDVATEVARKEEK
jgi:hypothetical protein